MAIRNIPLVTDQVYHIFNKSQGNIPVFQSTRSGQAMLDAIWYYQYQKVPMKLSYFRAQSKKDREMISTGLLTTPHYINLLAYCLMPNHYHLLIKQTADNGISKYMGNVQNSITRYLNIKHKQKGHIFIGQFKAIRIESDEQLLHVSRYIHLNPYTGYIVQTIEETKKYRWSSCNEYTTNATGFCDHELVLSHFKSKNGYEKFIEDRKDYQRSLTEIKYFTFD